MPPPSQSIEAHSVLWTWRSSRAWRDFTQHLFPVVKMTQHQGCFCQVWEVEPGGCCSLFSSRLCRIPYPKYMTSPSREMRQWEGKVGVLLIYKCPISFLLWCLTQSKGGGRKTVGFGHSIILLIPENHLPMAFQMPNCVQVLEVISIIK